MLKAAPRLVLLPMNITDQQLAELLQKSGKLDAEKLKKATEVATEKKLSFWDALVEADVASDEELGLLEASSLQLPFVVLTKKTIPPEVIGILPQDVAKQQHAVVFERDDKQVKVALSKVDNAKIIEVIAKKTGQAVSVFYATERDIENTIALYRKDLQRQFHKLLKDGLGSSVIGENHDPPIERIVDLLLKAAYDEKASDVHIEPRENGTIIRFRIDGLLYDALLIPAELHDRIVTRIKVLSSLRTDEHMAAQDGKMQMDLTEEVLDMRVSIAPVSDGEKVVLRLLSSKSRSYSLTDLGYNERDLMAVTKAFNKPNGMILSTGPTGSGKTTSIYALLKILNTREMNITSIEDPVEYKIAGANQIQVNTKANLTFANGLRSILRQDPYYIFVGEIRDNETASIAVNAALTGHLVLSTLHTNVQY
jgi:type IV pilus assembly protein PilB